MSSQKTAQVPTPIKQVSPSSGMESESEEISKKPEPASEQIKKNYPKSVDVKPERRLDPEPESSSTKGITMANFKQIKTGMSYSEVIEILFRTTS
jgi:hypothetical protein